MPKKQRPLADKFWERVILAGPDECWMFNNSNQTSMNGYGYLHHDGMPRLANRVSWIVHYGEIPDGLYVLHRCDKPGCVNPNHLFLGTQQDNVDDMMSKGRGASAELTRRIGDDNGMAKVSDEQRIEIVNLRLSGWMRKDLAALFELDESTIGRICKYFGVVGNYPKTWSPALREAMLRSRG